MRFGVTFIPSMPYQQVVDLCCAAERLGFDDFYLPDQTFHRDPFALLMACAIATKQIRLGLALTNPYTRHPVQIARGAGLLAEASDGRFVLGLGGGNKPRLLAGLGIEQTRILTRLREAVEVIRRLLAGDTVSWESSTLVLNDVRLDFDPGHTVPIVMGSRGPAVLKLAGELADIAMMEALSTPTALDWALETLQAGITRSGRSLDGLETVAWQSLFIGDENSLDQRMLRRWAALLIRTTRAEVLDRIGVSEEAKDAVAHEIEASGGAGTELKGAGVPMEDAAKLMFVGEPSYLTERFEYIQHRGVSSVACVLFGGVEEIASTMQRLAEIMAIVRRASL